MQLAAVAGTPTLDDIDGSRKQAGVNGGWEPPAYCFLTL